MNEDLIKALLANKDFVLLTKDLSLTNEQIMDNRFLIDEILKERENSQNLNIAPIILVGTDNLLYKSYVVSQKGVSQQYISNIKTQDVTKINLNINLSDIEQTKERATIGELLVKITKNYENIDKGLYIYGAPGRGKTFISQAIANWLAHKNHSVGFINTSDLVSYLKRSFGTGKIDKIINTLKNVEYLFIDDVGAENISDWFRDEIFLSILSSRMNNKMPTFYSSNYSLDQLLNIESATSKKVYYSKDKAGRLIERIRATSMDIKLLGKNYRY